jgi:MarR family 2-MHQ and catechol resistance regulon transcriptional repressor
MQDAAKAKQDGSKPRTEAVGGTQLWLVLMKAFHALSHYAAATLAETGLGDSDFRVLEALLHKGPLPVNVLGPKVFLTPGSISVAVDRLYKQQLVTRTEDAKDRRIRVVALTPKGRKLIEKIFAEHAAKMDALAEGLSAKERRRLVDGLKALGKRAAAESAAQRQA